MLGTLAVLKLISLSCLNVNFSYMQTTALAASAVRLLAQTCHLKAHYVLMPLCGTVVSNVSFVLVSSLA